MKRILFFCAAMLAAFTCNAQSIQVLKNGKVIYGCSDTEGVEVVFKEQGQESADPYNGHEYVDLGLPSGLKWATMNVGATKPEDYGDYFAWGETETKTYYSLSSYFDSDYSKYANKTTLDPEDDVAHVKWGGNWRMPTVAELSELKTECTWVWATTKKGVSGMIVMGPNGNFIFLPAAGYYIDNEFKNDDPVGDYWSSSRNPDWRYAYYAHYLTFNSSGVNWSQERILGRSVRAVCP